MVTFAVVMFIVRVILSDKSLILNISADSTTESSKISIVIQRRLPTVSPEVKVSEVFNAVKSLPAEIARKKNIFRV